MKKEPLPSPEQLAQEFAEIERLLRSKDDILRGYKVAYDLGLDPRSGSSGANVRAGLSNYVPEAAVESDRARIYRGIARSINGRLVTARQQLGNALSDAEWGEHFRQIEKPSRDAIITKEELAATLEKKREREATG